MAGLTLIALLPMLAASYAISVLPLWLAAQVVGAGNKGFLRSALTLGVTIAVAVALIFSVGFHSLYLIPLTTWAIFKRMLDTSYLGAFVLAVLWLSFNAIMGKFFGLLVH